MSEASRYMPRARNRGARRDAKEYRCDGVDQCAVLLLLMPTRTAAFGYRRPLHAVDAKPLAGGTAAGLGKERVE
eukprot:scaffold61743_cov75-Phaeocystis_antarctica.AAC.3